ncbi:MAG: polyhydroxyalkanoic acid system family protein [Bacteriovoracales bacterium]|nr:polyhydroxyalkanoic acid system family protein [Bacteriovoracales bacterium]
MIVVPYTKCASKEKAFEVVREGTAKALAKFKVEAAITDNGQDEIYAKGKGIDLKARFEDDRVEISLKLSLVLKVFQSKIEETIQKSMEEIV